MRVAHVAAEVAPWCSSGGLGQVLGALPAAIARTAPPGTEVAAYFPLCRLASEAAASGELQLTEVEIDVGGDGARLLRAESFGPHELYFVDAPRYFDRPALYGPYARPYSDDPERFAFFVQVLERVWRQRGQPDVVHCHDWHVALLPAFLKRRPKGGSATVLTIHNLAYQGVFEGAEARRSSITPTDGVVNFLATGIEAADVVTTVSPTYAIEILEDGAGLDAVLRARAAPIGILNGIDTDEWDPSADPSIPEPFTASAMEGKGAARRQLATKLGLDIGDSDLVVGVVSRLVDQKGIDLVIEAAADAERLGMRLAVVGDGDPELEKALLGLALDQPGRVAALIGWDKATAHLVIAGADALAVPSRFEPCGLTQMQAMRYGTIPIAHAVGGLRDTVIDPGDKALAAGEGSGLTFDEPTAEALVGAIERAAALRRDNPQGWSALQQAVMAIDWSWDRAAAGYLDLYSSLLAG
ncbi:MAG: glycogen synthase [Acidimicrobiia bacterium]|nr:glycogen synthase [Acidimicrobiia bacterium]